MSDADLNRLEQLVREGLDKIGIVQDSCDDVAELDDLDDILDDILGEALSMLERDRVLRGRKDWTS